MNQIISAFIAGGIFAIGLALSSMTNTESVQGFLNTTGDWKPQLALVMVGAILFHFLTMKLTLKRKKPIFEASFNIPPNGKIDAQLITGAIIFGLGWGLAGFCPGPAFASLGAMRAPAMVFVPFMLIGMWLAIRAQRFINRKK